MILKNVVYNVKKNHSAQTNQKYRDNEVSSKDFKTDIILLKDLKENVNIIKQEMERYFF